jgi:hypothetical protein
MARYTAHYRVTGSPAQIKDPLREVMKSCNIEGIYELEDYVMGREIPGKVPFATLVTVEVLIDTTQATPNEFTLCFVIKNEELPLKVNNHCQQVYDAIQDKIGDSYTWQLVGASSNGKPRADRPIESIDN